MTNSQLAKAWTAVGLFTLLFCLDSWLRTQGLSPMFGSELPHNQRQAAALFGFVVTALLTSALLRIAFIYTRRFPPGELAFRLPIAFYETLDTSQPEAKSFQRLTFFAFHIVPLAAMGHFLRVVLDSTYVVAAECDAGNATPNSLWSYPDPYMWDNGYRLGSCNGVTFFPVFEPVLLMAIGFALLAFSLRYWVFLCVSRTQVDSSRIED